MIMRGWGTLWLRRSVAGLLMAGLSASALYADILRFDYPRMPAEAAAAMAVVAPAPAKSLTVPRCAQPPVLDGKLDDPAWRDAVMVRDLSINSPLTRFWVCYDDRALYVAVECTEVPGRARKVETWPRDGRAYSDDCIECWFHPIGAPAWFQFVVNAANSFYDSREEDKEYDPQWSHATRQEKGEWTLEMAIPRAALGLSTGWVSPIGFNLGRNLPGYETRSWFDEWGATQQAVLVLQGMAPTTAVKAETARPPRPRQNPPGETLLLSGQALVANFARLAARPEDRWIEVQLFADVKRPLKESRLTATLTALDGKPIASQSVTPEQYGARLCIDLREANASAANLLVQLFEGAEETGRAATRLSLLPTPPAATGRVPLTVDVPEGFDPTAPWPVAFGVPFPAGILWDLNHVRLVDKDGKEIPHQKEIAARWAPEGAIKWVRFETSVSGAQGCQMEIQPSTPPAPAMPVQVKADNDQVTLTIGAVQYLLGKGPSPVVEVRRDGKPIATSKNARGLYVIDQTGRAGTASPEGETLKVESSGPVAACVRLEGDYRDLAGKPMARHITRLEAFAGQPFLKITHTLVLTQDSNEVWFKDIGWEFAVTPGANPQALFGLHRDKPAESVTHPLTGVKSAYMLQDRHYRFVLSNSPARPEDTHFSVVSTDTAGKATTVREGSECGDWAMLQGANGALMIGCRDASRQHPKEFELSADKFVLRLFSGRAGEELDFRAPALAKRWNLRKWMDITPKYNFLGMETKPLDEIFAEFLKTPSNAAGWSKTHDLLLAPLAAPDAVTAAPRLGGALLNPVYVHLDPKWVYRTEALGPLHPKDTERFPQAEDVLDRTLEVWKGQAVSAGLYGFIDYGTGPYPFPSGPDPAMARWNYSYDLRTHLLLLYARSGDRSLREFALRSNRVFLDGNYAHWNAPNKIKGMWLNKRGPEYGIGRAALPFYWETTTETDNAGSATVDHILSLYYLTGDRRARECVEECFAATKSLWNLKFATQRQMFPLRLFHTLVQGYAFTGDPDYAALARASLDVLYDPQTELLMNPVGRYAETYKISQDLLVLINAWNLLGDPRLYDMAARQSRYLLDNSLGQLVRYNSAQGLVASFLWRQKRDPFAAQDATLILGQIGTFYDPEKNQIINVRDIPFAAARVRAMTEGLWGCEDAIERSNVDRKPLASWAGAQWMDPGYIVVRKTSMNPIEMRCVEIYRDALDAIQLTALEAKPGEWGTDLNSLATIFDAGATVRIEKYAPKGAYKLSGRSFVMAGDRSPMVVYAPGYWRPLPAMRPAARVYFKVPEKSEKAQIFFEGPTQLFDPTGKAMQEGKTLTGWVDLPADKPGLWSCRCDTNKLLRVRNLPPFFALNDPALYFEPPIAWSREEIPPAQAAPTEQFVPGAIATPKNQALNVTAAHPFELAAGEAHLSGDGTRFLPFRQGTIEFFYQPFWSAFDADGAWRQLMTMKTNKGDDWKMDYYNGGSLIYTVGGTLAVTGTPQTSYLDCRASPVLFERGRWVHLAMTWGPLPGPAGQEPLEMTVYVNGRPGSGVAYAGALPSGIPTRLLLMAGGAYDELRISDVRRYSGPFTPPARDTEFQPDDHTRALFHFNGDDRPLGTAVRAP